MTALLTEQYCTFTVADLHLGVRVQDVQEVLRHQEMSSAPAAPGAVRGLLNLRGQIVTAIDLRHRLGLPPRPDTGDGAMNVVIRSRGEIVSLLVDDIGEVIDTEGVPVEAVPATVPAAVRDAVTGVLALPDHILLVLDAVRAGDVSPPTPGEDR